MKKLTFFLLKLLPKKLTVIYSTICFYYLIKSIRNKNIDNIEFDVKLINNILELTLNKDTFILPMATYQWLWSDATVENNIIVRDNNKNFKSFHVRTVILYPNLYKDNIDAISNYFISELPLYLKKSMKLNTNKKLKNALQNNFNRILIEA